MDIILKGGPCDGEVHPGINECRIFTRYAKAKDARYKDSGTRDSNGRRIFEHWPPKPGEADPTEGVHHA